MRSINKIKQRFWNRIEPIAKRNPRSIYGQLFTWHLKNLKKGILYGTGSGYRCVLDVHLVHHCNLSCAYCSHFSPVADEWYISAEQLEKELTIIAPHIKGHISNVWLLGGEPLLHPNIINLLYTARKCLPDIPLDITTNGILLNKMGEEFYDALIINDIGIRLSEYPIELNYKNLINNLKGRGIRVIFQQFKSKFCIQKMNTEWNKPYKYNYWSCYLGGYVLELLDGKLYSCPQVAFWEFLNKRFGTNFKHKKEDYLLIKDIRTWKDIMRFRLTPKRSCKFCNADSNEWREWKLSERVREEWIG